MITSEIKAKKDESSRLKYIVGVGGVGGSDVDGDEAKSRRRRYYCISFLISSISWLFMVLLGISVGA